MRPHLPWWCWRGPVLGRGPPAAGGIWKLRGHAGALWAVSLWPDKEPHVLVNGTLSAWRSQL